MPDAVLVVGQSKASVALSTHRNRNEAVCPERRIRETERTEN
jgi:hypothetical protein